MNHEKCTHPRTKVARAACRRAHTEHASPTVSTDGKTLTTRSGRLPSMIAPKLRPIIDAARERGLVVKQLHDPSDDVEQAFLIHRRGGGDCQLIAEAFRAVGKNREGKAEFYHVEGSRSRQLSRARALADLDTLAVAKH